jgi:hypothetical protein
MSESNKTGRSPNSVDPSKIESVTRWGQAFDEKLNAPRLGLDISA